VRATRRRSAALPLLLLVAVAACAAPASRGPLGTPVPPSRIVLEDHAVTALGELLRMEDERTLDLPRLHALLGDAQPFVRSRAALAAGRVGDTAALPALIHALADPDPTVQEAAAFALGEAGDTSAAPVAALADALGRGRGAAAAEAAHALGKLASAAAHAALARALAGPAAGDALVQREALLAIWRHPRQPTTLATVLPWTARTEPELRWAATFALMRVTAPEAIPRLLELLGDADSQVRALAARGLRAGAADSAGRGTDARAALRAALADPHPHVRINATRALAAFRQAADGDALRGLLRDPDGNVQLATLEALAQLPAGAVADALGEAAADAALPLALRAAAATSLARTDTAAALPVLAAWSGASGWLERFYAARALGATGARGFEALKRLARDPDPRVQGEAFGSLAAADTSAPLGALFLEGLAAADPIVRAAAAGGLARRNDPAYLSALMQAFDRAQRDTANDAALAALDGLAGLARTGAPVARSFFLRFRPSPDPVVRARVAQHFGSGEDTWGPARPVRAGRDAAFYEQQVRTYVAPLLAGAPAPRVRIRTARGDIVVELAAADAPLTVHNFLTLIRTGFYERAQPRWHRVVPNFVLQDGDPRGDGSGGPAWIIRDEINPLRYGRGTLGMALSGPDTGGSQFFITHSPQPHLDGGYTVFGRVVSGLDAADALVQDDAILGFEVLP
jgi:cyclophilin family peptidyl-prolyl cis-trans isomerase/HEAT repeat protein